MEEEEEEEETTRLLEFQKKILKEINSQDGILILSRGLGLGTIIVNFLKPFSTIKSQIDGALVLVINATSEDEASINDLLGMRMSCIGHEINSSERERMFKLGGILSITSRILIVDMLNSKIDLTAISGIVVLHAEEVTPASIEAFIIRVFRKSNNKGFIKAFSDEPEHFTQGFSPLQTVLTQLKLRNVFLWPRFRVEIKQNFEDKKHQVIELHQPMSSSMSEIQTAIVESMEATLSEIKRGNTNLEVDDLTVDNALHRSFDQIIRNQLNPIWHRVSYKTKQLVSDLSTLRKLLLYLLNFDCVMFYRFLETIQIANSTKDPSTGLQQNESPWLFTTSADTIFSVAKNRLYTKSNKQSEVINSISNLIQGPTEEEEQAMREIQEIPPITVNKIKENQTFTSNSNLSVNTWNWLPKGTEPVLENQPKWTLLQDVLKEIEDNLILDQAEKAESNQTRAILIMCSSTSTCSLLKEFLATQHNPTDTKFGTRGMMKRRLKDYFYWKRMIGKMSQNRDTASNKNSNSSNNNEQDLSAALKRKAEYQRKANYLNKRRRVRGASNVNNSNNSRETNHEVGRDDNQVVDLLDSITDENRIQTDGNENKNEAIDVLQTDELDVEGFAAHFDMLSMDDLVVIQVYLGDEDDAVLEELRPQHIIMYEPELSFVRRIECYRARHPELNVKPYFLMYRDSVEEQKYLSCIRREKDSFERLIRENSTMVIPLDVEVRGTDHQTELVQAISSRQAGGSKTLKVGIPKVIVDVREFRSSLPSLLHAANFTVEPTTLLVGDYILSPEMCVERKSVVDLIQSFNSGRLYQQCEMMSAHYKHPILLIEFDQNKSFTLETYKEARGNKSSSVATGPARSDSDLQAKLVLLTLSFKKLRLIWSSSPSATAEIFRELKLKYPEPEVEVANQVGMDELSKNDKNKTNSNTTHQNDQEQQQQSYNFGVFSSSHEILKSLPGMDEFKARNLIHEKFNLNQDKINNDDNNKSNSIVKNLFDLCQLSKRDLKNFLGIESGSRLFNFIHEEVDNV